MGEVARVSGEVDGARRAGAGWRPLPLPLVYGATSPQVVVRGARAFAAVACGADRKLVKKPQLVDPVFLRGRGACVPQLSWRAAEARSGRRGVGGAESS